MYFRVGFDLDGVLYNFGDSVRRYLEYTGQGHLWKSGPTESPFWNFFEDWGWTTQQFVDFCNKGADEGFIFCGPCREGAVEAVNLVKEMGHEVIIITDRKFGRDPSVSKINTYKWLDQHKIPFDEIYFSADKTIVPTDMFVEDKIANYDALKAAGTDAYLMNRPWNEPVDDGRVRVPSVLVYANLVALKTMYQGV